MTRQMRFINFMQYTHRLLRVITGVVLCQFILTACSSVNVTKDSVNPDPKAAETLLKSTGLSVKSVNEALIKAANAIQEGKMDLAQLYYIKGFELQPNNVALLQKMVDLYVQLEKYDLAEVSLKLILQQQPNNTRVLEQYGLLLLKQRKYQEAKANLGQVIAKQLSWTAYNGLGIIATEEADLVQAEYLFKKADRILPNNPEILNNLGFVLCLADKCQEAIAYYHLALQIDPRFKKALDNYALLQARLGHYDLAYEAFVKVSSEAEANNNLGYIAMMKGDYDLANNYLQEAIKLSPHYYKKANENMKHLEWLVSNKGAN